MIGKLFTITATLFILALSLVALCSPPHRLAGMFGLFVLWVAWTRR